MADKAWWEIALDSDVTPEPQEKATLGVAAPAPLPKVKAESLTTANFMPHVLPGQGVYTLFTTGDKTNYWFDTMDEMVAGIKRLGDRPDIYFGVANFKERGTDKAGRTQANVARLKCFKLDLDAGEKKLKTQGPDKVYQDQAQALQALKAFTETTGLTPTFIVSSGEGLHVYYVLSEEVTPEQWRPVAKQLQEFGKSHGLKIDSSVAVLPQADDVSPWLQLLDALIPDATDREYVVKWLAWKVQNPGGVPDSVLILTGKKGTGKNSLFEPVLTLFGKHGMLVDNPELIAGRFTGHMMDKCLAVMDEAIFTKDPRQQDCIKSRTTAKVMMFEAKGLPPVSGINRCAYVMLTNHEHVWQATADERRAVPIEVCAGLKGNFSFWKRYHDWCNGDGPAALLHYLQHIDLTGFNPRLIPKGEALRKQIEMTALRDPAVSWWHQCLTEGAIRWRDAGFDRAIELATEEASVIDVHVMRESYEQGGGGRGINGTSWAQVAKRLHAWCGPGGLQKARPRGDAGGRLSRYTLPPLDALREHFTKVTNVIVEP